MRKVNKVQEGPPILYSFRRCPYAIRARLAIAASGQKCVLREVIMRDKPPEMIAVSPKGTVPVLVLPNNRIIEESLEIMYWALNENDPDGWLVTVGDSRNDINKLITENDGSFKNNLDRYKYPTRFENADPLYHRAQCLTFLVKLNDRLNASEFLDGNKLSLIDAAISPFIRQFANTDRIWFDELDLSGVQRWLKTILESDCFTSVMQKYPAWDNGMKEPIFP